MNSHLHEKSPITKAKSPYANTKIIGEQIIKDLCKSNKSFNSIILRYFNAIGAHKSWATKIKYGLYLTF